MPSPPDLDQDQQDHLAGDPHRGGHVHHGGPVTQTALVAVNADSSHTRPEGDGKASSLSSPVPSRIRARKVSTVRSAGCTRNASLRREPGGGERTPGWPPVGDPLARRGRPGRRGPPAVLPPAGGQERAPRRGVGGGEGAAGRGAGRRRGAAVPGVEGRGRSGSRPGGASAPRPPVRSAGHEDPHRVLLGLKLRAQGRRSGGRPAREPEAEGRGPRVRPFRAAGASRSPWTAGRSTPSSRPESSRGTRTSSGRSRRNGSDAPACPTPPSPPGRLHGGGRVWSSG